MTSERVPDRPRRPDRREASSQAPLLPTLVAGQADAGEPARVRDLLLPARGRVPDLRLGRALRLRGRGAAAGAAREPDRRRAGRARIIRRCGGVSRRRSAPRRPSSPRLPRTPEVAETIAEFRRATREGSVAEGLAALYAYESQIPEVSKTKREGLAAFYGIDGRRRDALLLGPRGGRRVAPAGRAGGARAAWPTRRRTASGPSRPRGAAATR